VILPVRLYIDKVLHMSCDPVTDFTNLQDLAESMLSTMFAFKGIGLAANQIGLAKQLFVANIEDKSRIIMVANPKVICYNKEWSEELEGCLSAPNISVKIKRPTWVEFEYQKLNGEKDKMRLEGFDCRIFFHEYSHLQGQMITDSIGKL
jgi:peptide deformylase